MPRKRRLPKRKRNPFKSRKRKFKKSPSLLSHPDPPKSAPPDVPPIIEETTKPSKPPLLATTTDDSDIEKGLEQEVTTKTDDVPEIQTLINAQELAQVALPEAPSEPAPVTVVGPKKKKKGVSKMGESARRMLGLMSVMMGPRVKGLNMGIFSKHTPGVTTGLNGNIR